MNQGYSESQAEYSLDASRRDISKPYTPKPRKGWTVEEFEDLGLTIEPSDNEYGWEIKRKGRKKVIFVTKGTVYKSGGCKYYPAIQVQKGYKSTTISLGIAVWVGYLKREIPAGYVIDHIDNDSFNNSVENLQMLTIRQNLEKNPAKNQGINYKEIQEK